MADFNNQWIEIFKAGNYGKKGTWAPGDVSAVVKNFDPSTWQPPAVFGHPEHDSPAMGLVRELREDSGRLFARFEKVHPALEASVADGRYPNRSAAFYVDPEGKGPVLRHVGFLGAMPPEVKGLAPIRFAKQDFVEIDIPAESHDSQQEVEMEDKQITQKVEEGIRGFFSKLFGEKAAASTFSEEQVQERIASAQKPLLEKIDALAAKFDESLSQAEKRVAQSDADIRKSKVAAFVEKLKAAGKYVPAYDEHKLPEILASVAAMSEVLKFGEGEKAREVTLYDAFTAFLEAQSAIVPTGELAGGQKKSKSGKVIPFTAAKGITLSEDSVALNERAEEIAAEQKVSFGEALRIAREESGAAGSGPGGMTSGAL